LARDARIIVAGMNGTSLLTINVDALGKGRAAILLEG